MKNTVNTIDSELKLIEYVEKNFDIEQLQKMINDMSIVAWGNRMERTHLTRWLKNFNGKILGNNNVEKIIALWILMNFTFYTEREVRAMCKCIFDDYIHNKLLEYESTDFMSDESISKRVQHIISNTLFLPLGNSSESGTSVLYFFRHENDLSIEPFSFKENKSYENIVYIDDVTISGTQADRYINQGPSISASNKFLLTFITSDEAIVYLEKYQRDIKLIYSILLDDRSRCFSDCTFVFSGPKGSALRGLAYKMCKGYGELMFKGSPLGYGTGQQLFGFYYNTPDNTLPIIWSDQNSWAPAFHRYNKKYRESEVIINESKYL